MVPYILGLLILFLVNYIYFLPQFQGKQVLQGDIVSYTGAYGEIAKYWAEKVVIACSSNIYARERYI